ncbi:hypothetical protein DCC85_11585 [Paenibacillus sp. CAA11]|uniref:WD40/YVTN/BNR-like repeat-containing protein n=1 Tax=Paenibacillus sp. CAA11 TaxID=1532905 RepID=UPI000D33B023|nr:hypothetical protein [Paenibacillus sp. CAA11]AWB44797.1 hypothetical protein DCC85_11585 [Paenibacillus sp. CAA11]
MRNQGGRIMVLLLLAGMLLTACTSSKEQPKDLPAEHDSQEKGQTLTVIEPNRTEPETTKRTESPEKKYQIQTRLSDFHLLSDTTGIAWGSTRGELRLYRTEDNGTTWTNISPAGTVQFPGIVRYGKELFFADSMNGWIVRNGGGTSETIVLYTTDGGVNWKVSSLPKSVQVSDISFVSKQQGWLMTTQNSTPGNQEKLLYRTLDGGKTWKTVMHSQTDNSSTTPLPEFGYISDMEFGNSMYGYVVQQELDRPKLYITTDGGYHWRTSNSNFEKKDMGKCDQYTSRSISFLNAQHTSAWVPVGCSRGQESKYNGYFTADRGATWSFAAFPLEWQSGPNRYIPPTFINGREGWSLSGVNLLHTMDQGKTWAKLPVSDKLEKMMTDYPEVAKLEFVSSSVGWILIQNYDERKSLLLQTKDGGMNWRVL